jgi:hypothetical protein
LGVCIRTGWIVWLHGPFAPGDWNDLMIFRDGLKPRLLEERAATGRIERVEADDGYTAEDPLVVKAAAGVRYMEDTHWNAKRGKARRRHETVNERIKNFEVLTKRFEHDVEKHSMCFRACAILAQLCFQHGKRSPYEVNNYDQVWMDPSRAPVPGVTMRGDEDYEPYADL